MEGLTLCVTTPIFKAMNAKLKDEIKQTRPFASLEQEAYLSLGRTWALLEHTVVEALKPYGITPTQYNVLRILRGAGQEGLCRNEVMERMIARVPDATRLLDRMEASGLIVRERSSEDRRFVTARVSAKGLALLEELEDVIQELHQSQFAAVDQEGLRTLIRVLEGVRRGT